MADSIEQLVRRSQFEAEKAWSGAEAGQPLGGGAPLRGFVPLLAEHAALTGGGRLKTKSG